MRRIVNTVLMMIVLVLIAGLLLAIGAETDKPAPERRPSGLDIDLPNEDVPHLVEIIRIWKLVDELELNEEQLIKFLPKFKELIDLRDKYFRSRRKTVTELENLLEANASQDHLKSAIDEFKTAEVDYYVTYRRLNDELDANLNVKQRAKFVVFQERYRSDMRSLIRTLKKLSDQREPRRHRQPNPLQAN